MTNVQLPGSKQVGYQMQIHIITQNNDVRFYEEFQQRLSKEHSKNGIIDQVKYKKNSVKENGQTDSIMFKLMLMFHT